MQNLEVFKDELSFTPSNKIKSGSESPTRSLTPKISFKPFEPTPILARPLPRIFNTSAKLMKEISCRTTNRIKRRKQNLEESNTSDFTMFQTEVPDDISVSPYKTTSNRFRNNYFQDKSIREVPQLSPARMLTTSRNKMGLKSNNSYL